MNNINKATSGNNNINFPQNNNANNNNVINNNNKNNFNNCNYFNGYNNGNINNNINKNTNDIAKKNLNELFNNAKNDNSLYDKEKMKFINNINNFNNCNIINNINHYTNNNTNNNYINERKRFNRNCNLQISRQFIFSSPLCSTKPKKYLNVLDQLWLLCPQTKILLIIIKIEDLEKIMNKLVY